MLIYRNMIRQTKVPSEIKHWLMAEGSLTRQLTEFAKGQFQVQPLQEKFTRLTHAESKRLGVKSQQVAWVREVYLYGNTEKPWVLARSIFPLTTLTGRGRYLRHLKTRSLGSVLFHRRESLNATGQHQVKRHLYLNKQGWARVSVYTWRHRPIEVQEIFLDEFLQQLER